MFQTFLCFLFTIVTTSKRFCDRVGEEGVARVVKSKKHGGQGQRDPRKSHKRER